jgi:hypothetical protein
VVACDLQCLAQCEALAQHFRRFPIFTLVHGSSQPQPEKLREMAVTGENGLPEDETFNWIALHGSDVSGQ